MKTALDRRRVSSVPALVATEQMNILGGVYVCV